MEVTQSRQKITNSYLPVHGNGTESTENNEFIFTGIWKWPDSYIPVYGNGTESIKTSIFWLESASPGPAHTHDTTRTHTKKKKTRRTPQHARVNKVFNSAGL